MIALDLLTRTSHVHPAIALRRRWPCAFKDEATAVAQGIRLLDMHPEVMGFVVLPVDLQATNDAAFAERTIMRASAARAARRARKATMEVQQ